MMDFDVIDGWQEELERMNQGKIGEPYHYPESFVQLLGYMRVHISIYLLDRLKEWSWHMLERRYHPYQTTVPLVGASKQTRYQD